MNVDFGIWSKLTRVVIVLIGLAVIGAVVIWYLPLTRQNERMRKEILKKDAQIQQQHEVSKQLKASIDSLRDDPKVVERLAREKFGYVKPGETVVRFEESATNTVTNTPTVSAR